MSGVNTIGTEQRLAREAQGVAVSSPGEVAAEEETLAAAEQRIQSYSKRGIESVKEMGRELIVAEKSAGPLDRRPNDLKKTVKCSAEFWIKPVSGVSRWPSLTLPIELPKPIVFPVASAKAHASAAAIAR